MPLELHVFQASLSRKARWLASLIQANYEDQDPIHVAHRSLRDEHRRREADADARAAEEGEAAAAALAAVTRGNAEQEQEQEETEKGGGVVVAAPAAPLEREYRDNAWTRVFLLLDEPNFSTESKCMSLILCSVVVLSCFSYLLGTMDKFKYIPTHCASPICVPGPDAPCTHTVCFPQPKPSIYYIEVFSMVVFTLDYLARVACVHAVPFRLIHPESYVKGYLEGLEEPNGLTKTVSYAFSFLNIVDLCAIIPFYAHFLVHRLRTTNLAFLRLLRLLRVVRVFKLGRYSEGHAILHETFVASVPALLIMCFFLLVVTLLFGALIFYCEEGVFKVTEEYPEGAYFRPSNSGGEEVSPFKSIPQACYYIIMTATTVGYGDFYPVTPMGRVIAVVVAYSGIVSIALPVTIIGKYFNDVYFAFREKACQEKAKAEAQAAHEAALAAAAAPLQLQSAEQTGGDKALVLVNEEALSSAIQRQLNALALASTAAPAATTKSVAKGAPGSLPLPHSLASASATSSSSDVPPPAAVPAAAPAETPVAAATGVGLRRRSALTGLIREQLLQMDTTMRTLAARLEELENAPQ